MYWAWLIFRRAVNTGMAMVAVTLYIGILWLNWYESTVDLSVVWPGCYNLMQHNQSIGTSLNSFYNFPIIIISVWKLVKPWSPPWVLHGETNIVHDLELNPQFTRITCVHTFWPRSQWRKTGNWITRWPPQGHHGLMWLLSKSKIKVGPKNKIFCFLSKYR